MVCSNAARLVMLKQDWHRRYLKANWYGRGRTSITGPTRVSTVGTRLGGAFRAGLLPSATLLQLSRLRTSRFVAAKQ